MMIKQNKEIKCSCGKLFKGMAAQGKYSMHIDEILNRIGHFKVYEIDK